MSKERPNPRCLKVNYRGSVVPENHTMRESKWKTNSSTRLRAYVVISKWRSPQRRLNVSYRDSVDPTQNQRRLKLIYRGSDHSTANQRCCLRRTDCGCLTTKTSHNNKDLPRRAFWSCIAKSAQTLLRRRIAVVEQGLAATLIFGYERPKLSHLRHVLRADFHIPQDRPLSWVFGLTEYHLENLSCGTTQHPIHGRGRSGTAQLGSERQVCPVLRRRQQAVHRPFHPHRRCGGRILLQSFIIRQFHTIESHQRSHRGNSETATADSKHRQVPQHLTSHSHNPSATVVCNEITLNASCKLSQVPGTIQGSTKAALG